MSHLSISLWHVLQQVNQSGEFWTKPADMGPILKIQGGYHQHIFNEVCKLCMWEILLLYLFLWHSLFLNNTYRWTQRKGSRVSLFTDRQHCAVTSKAESCVTGVLRVEDNRSTAAYLKTALSGRAYKSFTEKRSGADAAVQPAHSSAVSAEWGRRGAGVERSARPPGAELALARY